MKWLLYTGMSVMLLLAVSCKNDQEKSNTETVLVSQDGSGYSQVFLQNITSSLEAYFNLKDAFVASDTVAVRNAALALKSTLDSMSLEEVRLTDSLAFAAVNGRPGDITAEIDALLAEKGLEEKRMSFEMISNAFYDLLRTIRPKGVTVYYQYCPMAFEDKGAYWLSKTDSIRNPYFGAKMLTCGEVKETLKY